MPWKDPNPPIKQKKMLSIKDDLFTSKIKMNGKHLMKEFINALGGKVEKKTITYCHKKYISIPNTDCLQQVED